MNNEKTYTIDTVTSKRKKYCYNPQEVFNLSKFGLQDVLHSSFLAEDFLYFILKNQTEIIISSTQIMILQPEEVSLDSAEKVTYTLFPPYDLRDVYKLGDNYYLEKTNPKRIVFI
jgi:hypothetical protein